MKWRFHPLLLLTLSISFTNSLSAEKLPEENQAISLLKMHKFISKSIPLRADGKIYIPSTISHVKLDIGLSYSAPMSQNWLSNEGNLIVFGFEPNPMSVNSILSGTTKQHASHGEPLDTKYIGNAFFLVPCALGNSNEAAVRFFVTKADCGCSSIYPPKTFEVESIINVPIFKLSDFFDLFPFDTHPIIEYIKIDAQGADLDIAKSAGNYLKERVVFITIEPENSQYENTNNSAKAIDSFMKESGFIKYQSNFAQDPTYINTKFLDYAEKHKIRIYQEG